MKHEKMLKEYPEFNCVKCGCNTLYHGEYYMVHNKLWKQAHRKRKGMLCIGCFEENLGRQLTSKDFTDAPVNNIDMFEKSERLKSRLQS